MDHDTLTVKVAALTATVLNLQRQLNSATALLIELCIDFYDEGNEDNDSDS